MCPRGWRKPQSCIEKERRSIPVVIEPTGVRDSEKRATEKTDHPARPSLGARHADIDINCTL